MLIITGKILCLGFDPNQLEVNDAEVLEHLDQDALIIAKSNKSTVRYYDPTARKVVEVTPNGEKYAISRDSAETIAHFADEFRLLFEEALTEALARVKMRIEDIYPGMGEDAGKRAAALILRAIK